MHELCLARGGSQTVPDPDYAVNVAVCHLANTAHMPRQTCLSMANGKLIGLMVTHSRNDDVVSFTFILKMAVGCHP